MGALSILVVEDIPLVAKGIETRLKSLGYGVAGSARDGESAIEMARQARPDLILMDVHLGQGINGIEAATRIQAIMEVPIVYLTAYSDDETLKSAKGTDLYGYVVKPYEDNNLKTAIEIAHHKHTVSRNLRESERWLSATLSSIGDGVIAVHPGGQIRFMNPLAERLTGWNQVEASGQPIEVVMRLSSDSSEVSVANPVREALQCGGVVNLGPDVYLEDRWGIKRPIDDSAAPIKGKNDELYGAVMVFRDITQRRELELQLLQSQKMESLGRMAGGIAHDLNNLLTSILGFSELILHTPKVPAGALDSAFTIYTSVKRAIEITRQITSFSRKQPVQMRPLDLNGLVRDSRQLLKGLLGNLELHLDLDEGPAEIKADAGQIHQILLNLAANARDAMPEEGIVRIVTRIVAGREVHLAFSDQGCGMSVEIQKSLFEPYFTTKEVGKGSGLGLATVYGIVQQSGGRIEVESQPDLGTTFHIYLPLLRKLSANPEPGNLDVTLLLVEDEPSVRKMLAQLLERQGYRILVAEHGGQALEVMRSSGHKVDLVLADLTMPVMGGRQLAAELERHFGFKNVLFMSGGGHQVYPSEFPVLIKPFTLTELAQRVQELLGPG